MLCKYIIISHRFKKYTLNQSYVYPRNYPWRKNGRQGDRRAAAVRRTVPGPHPPQDQSPAVARRLPPRRARFVSIRVVERAAVRVWRCIPCVHLRAVLFVTSLLEE